MIQTTVIPDARLQALYEHWRKCRGHRRLPARADFAPVDLPGKLWPHMLVLDVVHGEEEIRFRYRRVGKVFWDALGYDPTGCFVGDVLLSESDAYREYIIAVLREAVNRRQPIYCENLFTLHGQAVPMLTRRLIMPFTKKGGDGVETLINGHVFEYGEDYRLVAGQGVLQEGVRLVLED